MTLRSYEFRDLEGVVAEVLTRHRAAEGDTFLALVHDPPRAQEVVHTTHLPRDVWSATTEYELSALLRERVQAMPVPDWNVPGSPKHAIVTITCRRGLTVFGADEVRWLQAWRFSNHLMCAFSGDVVLVTEHGWADFMTGRGGVHPCLASVGTRPPGVPAARG